MKFNKKELKQVEEALHKLSNDTVYRGVQRLNKKFARLQAPFTLQEALTSLTKDELTDLRRMFNVPRASQLKKTELVSVLADHIPLKLEERLKNWDKERCDLLIQACNHNGILTIEQLELEVDKEIYFAATGIFYMCHRDDELIIAIPSDLIDLLKKIVHKKEVQAIIKRNTEWIKLTHGLCFYYGVLPIENMNQLLNRFTSIEEVSDYFNVINDAINYYEEIESNYHGYAHYLVDEVEEVLQEQKSRVGLDYYPFTKEQLLQAGAPEYVEQNQYYQDFVTLLNRHFDLNKEDAEDITEEITIATKNGLAPTEVMTMLSNEVEIQGEADLNELAHSLFTLLNHTRQWILKGYTPVELRPTPAPAKPKANNVISFQTGKKIGRNEPCPCGSGKKYKKCCGQS